MYQRTLKRFVDMAGASFALVIAAVPMAAVAALIRYRMGPPVLYRVARPGLHARPFVLLKFRTMDDRVGSDGKPLPDRERVTPLGRLLRRMSLDELPQLLNVLKGEMSLVGPRPLNAEYLPLYSEEQAHRHDVKPGITGLAQISGRNALSWDERFRLDVLYTRHVTFLMDARILLKTVLHLLRRDSVAADGDVNVPMFTGSQPRHG